MPKSSAAESPECLDVEPADAVFSDGQLDCLAALLVADAISDDQPEDRQ